MGYAVFSAALLEKQSVLRKGSYHSNLNFFIADCCGFVRNFHKSLFPTLKRKVIACSPSHFAVVQELSSMQVTHLYREKVRINQ